MHNSPTTARSNLLLIDWGKKVKDVGKKNIHDTINANMIFKILAIETKSRRILYSAIL